MRAFVLLLALAMASPHALATGQATHTVTFPGEDYAPFHLEVRPGDTVTWRNDGGQGHDVRSADGLFNSPMLSGGASYSFTFSQPGTYNYRCSIHPSMVGTVVVLGAADTATATATATPMRAPVTPVPTIPSPATAVPAPVTAAPLTAVTAATVTVAAPTPAAPTSTAVPAATPSVEGHVTSAALAPDPTTTPPSASAAVSPADGVGGGADPMTVLGWSILAVAAMTGAAALVRRRRRARASG